MATVRRLAFGPQVCGRLDEGSTREWLVPDGRGGFAMGTVSGLRTRRYHGLLIAAGETPATRRMGLAARCGLASARPAALSTGGRVR